MKKSGVFSFVSIVLTLFIYDASSQINWQRSKGPYTGNMYRVITNQKGDVYASAEFGDIYRSTGGGTTWELIDPTIASYVTLQYSVLSVLHDNSIIAYRPNYGGLYKSYDDGNTWIKIYDSLK